MARDRCQLLGTTTEMPGKCNTPLDVNLFDTAAVLVRILDSSTWVVFKRKGIWILLRVALLSVFILVLASPYLFKIGILLRVSQYNSSSTHAPVDVESRRDSWAPAAVAWWMPLLLYPTFLALSFVFVSSPKILRPSCSKHTQAFPTRGGEGRILFIAHKAQKRILLHSGSVVKVGGRNKACLYFVVAVELLLSNKSTALLLLHCTVLLCCTR